MWQSLFVVKDFLRGEGCEIVQLTVKVPQEYCGVDGEVENMNRYQGVILDSQELGARFLIPLGIHPSEQRFQRF